MNDEINENKNKELSEIFYADNKNKNKIQLNDENKNKSENTFDTKGKNITFNEDFNMHFIIGAEVFSNLMEFMASVNSDVVFRIFNNRLRIYTVDAANTHSVHIEFKKIEFAEYVVDDFNDNENNDDKEFNLYVDISSLNELMIIKNYPVDIYIDTKKNMKIYFVCGRDIRWRRLNSMSDTNNVLNGYKKEEDVVNKFLNKEDFNKVIINHKPFGYLLSSMSKKDNKDQTFSGIIDIISKKDKFGYIIKDDLKGGEYWNYGEDVLVYSVNDDRVSVRLEYVKNYGKLKLSYQVKIFINENFPLMLETHMGGGNITVHYLMAPYMNVDNN